MPPHTLFSCFYDSIHYLNGSGERGGGVLPATHNIGGICPPPPTHTFLLFLWPVSCPQLTVLECFSWSKYDIFPRLCSVTIQDKIIVFVSLYCTLNAISYIFFIRPESCNIIFFKVSLLCLGFHFVHFARIKKNQQPIF